MGAMWALQPGKPAKAAKSRWTRPIEISFLARDHHSLKPGVGAALAVGVGFAITVREATITAPTALDRQSRDAQPR